MNNAILPFSFSFWNETTLARATEIVWSKQFHMVDRKTLSFILFYGLKERNSKFNSIYIVQNGDLSP